ncbi:MAG: peptidylprolyl isomerase [Janthinobacterium lividum]
MIAVPLYVNGELVPDAVLNRELLRLSSGLEMDAPHAGGFDPEILRAQAARAVVSRTLLLQAAVSRKLRVTAAEIEAERRLRWGSSNSVSGAGVAKAIEHDLLLARVQADLLRHVPRPSRAEVEQHYHHNRQHYFLLEAVEAAHILRAIGPHENSADAEAALHAAEMELIRGRPFAQVANRVSDCRGVGGSLGWVARGTMVQAFEDALFALQPGARSGIFRTIFGLHIATVLRRRKDGFEPLESVRMEIAKQLLVAARQQELSRQIAQMEAVADIRFVEGAAHG